MEKNNSLHLYIHKIKITVKCSQKGLRKFIEDSFFFFKKAQKTKFHINIDIDFSVAKDFLLLTKKNNKVGNNAYLSKDKLFFQSYGLIFEFKKNFKGISIFVCKQKKSGIFLKSKNIAKGIFLKQDNYFILRYSVLFPIIWFLSRKLNIHSLHGGAVAMNGKGYVFSGLAGVGKSMLTLYMTQKKNFKFLSDNFLIFDKKYIYPFPEWIRLLDDSKKLMPKLSDFLDQNTFKRNNKNYYRISKNLISKKVSPKIFIFSEIGNSCSIKSVKNNYALNRILLSKSHVKEFPEHSFISLLDLLYNEKKSHFENELKVLKFFLKKNYCYLFTLNKNISIEKNLDFLINKIK